MSLCSTLSNDNQGKKTNQLVKVGASLWGMVPVQLNANRPGSCLKRDHPGLCCHLLCVCIEVERIV